MERRHRLLKIRQVNHVGTREHRLADALLAQSIAITSSSMTAFRGADVNMVNDDVTVAGHLFKRGVVKQNPQTQPAHPPDAAAP